MLFAAIRDSELSPSEKRRALKHIGIDSEYMPHNGKREMARRAKFWAKWSSGSGGVCAAGKKEMARRVKASQIKGITSN